MSDRFSIRFMGVRGSIPTPMTTPDITAKLEATLALIEPHHLVDEASRSAFVAGLPNHLRGSIGGNSSCVHVVVGDEHLIFDAGTGIRVLGWDLMNGAFGKGQGKAHLVLSHTHWDHIMGLPFFTPMYVPGNRFTIAGCHQDLQERLKGQQQFQYFPVSFDVYGSDINFVDLSQERSYRLGEAELTWCEQYHPGRSFAYRLDYRGKSIVYATDAEYQDHSQEGLAAAAAFFKDADLVIFDAQYTMIDCMEKKDWGHSSTFIGIKLALQAGVKKMAFYHHEPTYSDFQLVRILESSRDFKDMIAPFNPLELILAVEGEVLDLL